MPAGRGSRRFITAALMTLKLISPALLLALTALSAPAHADLATLKKTCAACHQLDTTLVGPPLQGIAARYRDQPGAEDRLLASIRNGSSGQWGKATMPPAPQISENGARKLAPWVSQR